MTKNLPPLRIALLGLGTVGGGVLSLLHKNRDRIEQRAGRSLQIIAAAARQPAKKRDLPLEGISLSSDPLSLATSPDVDVLVEVMGGASGPAHESVLAAISSKKHVITANKALLATHGRALAEQAEQAKVHLLWEAAVMAGVPVIAALKNGLAPLTIQKISGVMNGTCAFILSTMASSGRSFDDVLAEAKGLGYIEADPRLDIDGIDTAHKLVLLAAVAFGQAPSLERVSMRGISSITQADIAAARGQGLVHRLVATATPQDCRVQLETLPQASPLGQLQGTQNALLVETEEAGPYFFQGPGAGAFQTATGILADIISIAQEKPPTTVFGTPAHLLK